MKELEQMLTGRKTEIDRLEVPAELEMRLHNALAKRSPEQHKKNSWKLRLAAVFIVVSLIGYNFDAVAFYGKKLIGYDQVMDGNLSRLNELGEGQVIGKSYKFKNGVTVTLSGIMLDQNQLLAFYTLADPRGNIDRVDFVHALFLEGMFSRYYMSSGHGRMNDAKTEIKNIASFETPGFFEKKLTLYFDLKENGMVESGSVTFKLDRNKAMGSSMKKVLNKTVDAEKTKINFKSIAASPTKTVVEGSVQTILELAVDHLQGERMRPGHLVVNLIANGKLVSQQGGGMSTDMKGITFHLDYDPLPDDLETLQLELVSFEADHDVKQQVEIRRDTLGQSIQVLGQDIEINKLYEADGNTYVTITTLDGVTLSRVYLLMDGAQAELKETNTDEYTKQADGTIYHTRTLCFPGTGKELELNIQRIKYPTTVNRVVKIPVN